MIKSIKIFFNKLFQNVIRVAMPDSEEYLSLLGKNYNEISLYKKLKYNGYLACVKKYGLYVDKLPNTLFLSDNDILDFAIKNKLCIKKWSHSSAGGAFCDVRIVSHEVCNPYIETIRTEGSGCVVMEHFKEYEDGKVEIFNSGYGTHSSTKVISTYYKNN